jgi:hypothetical protein
MKDFLLTLIHPAVVTEKLCGPGGVRAVIAENLLARTGSAPVAGSSVPARRHVAQ